MASLPYLSQRTFLQVSLRVADVSLHQALRMRGIRVDPSHPESS